MYVSTYVVPTHASGCSTCKCTLFGFHFVHFGFSRTISGLKLVFEMHFLSRRFCTYTIVRVLVNLWNKLVLQIIEQKKRTSKISAKSFVFGIDQKLQLHLKSYVILLLVNTLKISKKAIRKKKRKLHNLELIPQIKLNNFDSIEKKSQMLSQLLLLVM